MQPKTPIWNLFEKHIHQIPSTWPYLNPKYHQNITEKQQLNFLELQEKLLLTQISKGLTILFWKERILYLLVLRELEKPLQLEKSRKISLLLRDLHLLGSLPNGFVQEYQELSWFPIQEK